MTLRFVLVPSPFLGPHTWAAVAAVLRERGHVVTVPELADAGHNAGAPYWQQHAASVARALAGVPASDALILVGHSGAGPLLPVIAQHCRRPIARYLFVDAGLPRAGATRLDLLTAEAPEWAAALQRSLLAGGVFPTWTAGDLQAVVPDAAERHALLAELRPRALPFFSEPIPVGAGWPDAPCGYLHFSAPYDGAARAAETAGWPCRRLAGGHFQMLVDPPAVATALLDLVDALVEAKG